MASAFVATCVESGGTPYDVRLLTPGGRAITCATGLRLEATSAGPRPTMCGAPARRPPRTC
ncbi:hypothetical protein GCM10009801_18610 [Streptomyces albiaxialis]|uniref:Uncharacterized protein n=1 Tax=Streptomyces albiaxialis TaxID=329523 RepID=A0ABN2VQI8_9ACTN